MDAEATHNTRKRPLDETSHLMDEEGDEVDWTKPHSEPGSDDEMVGAPSRLGVVANKSSVRR